MEFKTQLGLNPDSAEAVNYGNSLNEYINLKLFSIGQPTFGDLNYSEFFGLSKSLLKNHQEKSEDLAIKQDDLSADVQELIDEQTKSLAKGLIRQG